MLLTPENNPLLVVNISNKKMRVLHITHLYPKPYDPMLGIAIHNQVKWLGKLGCSQKVLSPIQWVPFPVEYLSNKWRSYCRVPLRSVIDGIDVYNSRYLAFPKALFFDSSGFRMYIGIRGAVREIWRDFRFDLIHAHMALPDGHAGILLSSQYRVPLVITVQGTDLDITAKRGKRCLSVLRKVLAHADKVIAPTPRLAGILSTEFNIDPEVIGYGIDEGEVFTGVSELSSIYKDKRIVLSVSRLIKTKGIDLQIYAVLKLIRKYENILYLIVGDGPERARLESLASELGIEEHIEFVGALSHGKAMEYMSICDVFSLPSYQETFGLVYVEAMAHGKPIVGVKGQGIDGVISPGSTGLLAQPRDVDSLVDALDFLLSHPEKAQTMGERAQKLVLENYTWEKNAERTIEVYKEVLNAH